MDKKRRYRLEGNEPVKIEAFGLVSDESEYRISWKINQLDEISLTRQADWQIAVKNQPVTQTFAVYESITATDQRILLVSNFSAEGIWLSPARHIRYLLILQGTFSTDFISRLTGHLKAWQPQIRGIYPLDETIMGHLPL